MSEHIQAEDIRTLDIPPEEKEPITSVEDPDFTWKDVEGQWFISDNPTKIRKEVKKYLCDSWCKYHFVYRPITPLLTLTEILYTD
jgi:hypothetical protein